MQTISTYSWLGRLPSGRPVVLVLVVLAVFPFLMPNKSIAIQVLIWSIFALSYNILLGYTGLLSFSHASFFGIGSYAAALFLKNVYPSLVIAILLGLISSFLAGILLGWLSLRRRGVTFSMLTLAFNQMIFFLAFQVLEEYTGGDDGLPGVPTPSIRIPGLGTIPLVSVRYPENFYYFSYIVFAVCFVTMWKVLRSPFGYSLLAINESEERARATGYHTTVIQVLAFALAAAFAGVAGVLNTLYLAYVPIMSLHLLTSGSVLMMTILGGRESFIGPILGALLYWIMADMISRYTEFWMLYVGLIFMITVLLLRNGLAGLLWWVYQKLLALAERVWARAKPREVPAARE